eukprot:gene46201-11091_t
MAADAVATHIDRLVDAGLAHAAAEHTLRVVAGTSSNMGRRGNVVVATVRNDRLSGALRGPWRDLVLQRVQHEYGLKLRFSCCAVPTRLAVSGVVHRMPLWEKSDGMLLYSTARKFWKITNNRGDFSCGIGWVVSTQEHDECDMPREDMEWKQHGDADPDEGIVVAVVESEDQVHLTFEAMPPDCIPTDAASLCAPPPAKRRAATSTEPPVGSLKEGDRVRLAPGGLTTDAGRRCIPCNLRGGETGISV